ncbi:MAG: aminotransferase class V-fold PLP-dependent enzyme [Chitinophagaceae bacterium]
MSNETYFTSIRNNIIGVDQEVQTPFGTKKMIYADWIASGRLYKPIEKRMQEIVAPYCANTHTETSLTGKLMTMAYHEAKEFIKKEVNASAEDVLIFSGSGMTDSINKLQRLLGLRIPELAKDYLQNVICNDESKRPIVFITHIEHHSNQTSWLETIADVEIINPTDNGLVDIEHLKELLQLYASRKLKIASISACSNVTGIITPYHEIAEIMHQHGGLCFVDFACSAPYVEINMHPSNKLQTLDAIFISPHKFLGGPGTPGIMILHHSLCSNQIPDHAGGGTVFFTTPWKYHEYLSNIEDREDGGTPPFLQGIRASLCFKLKNEIGVVNMLKREETLLAKVFDSLSQIPNLHILADEHKHRLGAVSFFIDDLHYNLGVQLLNDLYGIQVRGGCACAGTYGHYLLKIDQESSMHIIQRIKNGDLFIRPGWIRLSVHPTLSDAELDIIIEGIRYIAAHHKELAEQYEYDNTKNIFYHKTFKDPLDNHFMDCVFKASLMES